MFGKGRGTSKEYGDPEEALRIAEIKDEIEQDIARKGKRGQAARDELDDRMADVLMDEVFNRGKGKRGR